MNPVSPRPLTEREKAVIQAALNRAPFGPAQPDSTCVASLRVVGVCECGCDSVFFRESSVGVVEDRVADGVGETAAGEEVGVILWATEGLPTHLELYNYGENAPRLPEPDTVRAYGK